MPFASQAHVITVYVFFLETASVEDRVETIIEVSLFCLVLEQRLVTGLGRHIHHLNHPGSTLVLLLSLEFKDIFLMHRCQVSRRKLQRLHHRVAKGVARVNSGLSDFVFFPRGVDHFLYGMSHDVTLCLGLRVLHMTDGTINIGFEGVTSTWNRNSTVVT